MIDIERNELLRQFAYEHWKGRGCPRNSRQADWDYALKMLEEFKWESMRILDSALLEIRTESTYERPATRAAKILSIK